MTDTLRDSYEAAPYESRAITVTHIDSMAILGRLHGLHPAPPQSCRVLELGCAAGGNLTPMAAAYPSSTFFGIDLAPVHIASAQAFAERLGLENVTFETGSILDIDESFGQFDYIICHGVYSWVPPDVQEAILRVCTQNLAPQGIAYVSYNAYPGWHVRMMVREMLISRDDPTLPPAERVARARAFAEQLASAGTTPPTLHLATIREEVEILRGQSDTHLLHEQLEPFNLPVYFAEFVRRASVHGLQFVAESSLFETRAAASAMMPDGDTETDPIRAEQYFDFIRGRMFRRTLLCHEGIPVSRALLASEVESLHVVVRSTPVPPSPEDAARGKTIESFRSPESVVVTTDNPLIIAVMHTVGEADGTSVSVPDLAAVVRERVNGTEAESLARKEGEIENLLLRLATSGLIAFRTAPSAHARAISERPVASPLARLQASELGLVTSMTHATVRLSPLEQFIIELLDGTRDRSDLVQSVAAAIDAGIISTGDERPNRAQMGDAVDAVLARLRQTALLVS